MSTKRKPVYDIKLAAYLIIIGHKQVAEPSFIGRPTWYFEDSPKINQDINQFFQDKTSVDALEYATVLYKLRSIVFQGRHEKDEERNGGGNNE